MKRIAVVGGGPSGLFTTFFLNQKSVEPLEISLFEADSRLGGKVRTEKFDSTPILYEAGAAELYQYGKDPLWLLVTQLLQLAVVRMKGKTVVLQDRILHNKHDIRRHFGKRTLRALEAFHRRGCSLRSFKQFYDSGWPDDNKHPWQQRSLESVLEEIPDKVARRYLNTLIHSDLATEPNLTNALFGLENYLINDPHYCKLYSIVGGLGKLIEALQARITAGIHLNTPVKSIGKARSDMYRVVYQYNGRQESRDFDAVFVALPNYWLPAINWEGGLLRGAMARHHAYYDHPAHYLRISVLFREPFWRPLLPDSYFHLDAFGGCCVYDEGTRHDAGSHGVLGWLVGGNPALAMSNCADDFLIDLALDSLPSEIGSGRPHFLEAHVHRWIGSVNRRPGGTTIKGSKKRHVPEPKRHPALLMVGDYLFDSTINGALDSAEIATDVLLRSLKITPRIVRNYYFDYYDGDDDYSTSFRGSFDGKYVVDLIKQVWKLSPPYRLLDAGSANGLTLEAFNRLGVQACGIENSWYIHAKTPRRWKDKNILGDVCDMPFEDNSFDFVYETCLAYVPEDKLDQAIQEMYRVARLGVILGSVTKDMTKKVVKKYELLYGVSSLLALNDWAERFQKAGFVLAARDARTASLAWKVEKKANKGETWYPSRKRMRYCFYSKVNGSAEVGNGGQEPRPKHRSAGV